MKKLLLVFIIALFLYSEEEVQFDFTDKTNCTKYSTNNLGEALGYTILCSELTKKPKKTIVKSDENKKIDLFQESPPPIIKN